MRREVELIEGMYVRCPFDDECNEFARTFIIGKIINIDHKYHEVNVVFFDHRNLRGFLDDLPNEKLYPIEDISRCLIMNNEKVIFKKGMNSHEGFIIEGFKKKEDPLWTYPCQVDSLKKD